MRFIKVLIFLFSLNCSYSYADSMSAFYGKADNSHLIEIPSKALKGEFDFQEHEMIGLIYQKSITHPSVIQKSLDFFNIEGSKSHVELIAAQHYTKSPLLEDIVAYQINSRPFEYERVNVRLGFSIGLSYIYGTPEFEDSKNSNPNKKYRLLNYNAYEASLWNQKEDLALFLEFTTVQVCMA